MQDIPPPPPTPYHHPSIHLSNMHTNVLWPKTLVCSDPNSGAYGAGDFCSLAILLKFFSAPTGLYIDLMVVSGMVLWNEPPPPSPPHNARPKQKPVHTQTAFSSIFLHKTDIFLHFPHLVYRWNFIGARNMPGYGSQRHSPIAPVKMGPVSGFVTSSAGKGNFHTKPASSNSTHTRLAPAQNIDASVGERG